MARLVVLPRCAAASALPSSSIWTPVLLGRTAAAVPSRALLSTSATAASNTVLSSAHRAAVGRFDVKALSAVRSPAASASPILSAVAAAERRRAAHTAATTTAKVSNNSGSGSDGATTDARLALALAGAALILYASSARLGKDRTLHCESFISTNFPTSKGDPKSLDNPLNPDSKYPQSQVNVYQLSFGTITGLCAGIFIKKGLKALAFLLGAGYVLLQYLSSQRLVNVNWNAIGARYDKLVDRAAGETGAGVNVRGWKGSKLQRIWNRLVDFLTADFQPRATFLAGLLLGFRLG